MSPQEVLDEAVRNIARLRAAIGSGGGQVRATEVRALAQATAYSWSETLRAPLAPLASEPRLAAVDDGFRGVLECAGRASTKTRYRSLLRTLVQDVNALRALVFDLKNRGNFPTTAKFPIPNFARLTPDAAMRDILVRRWTEIGACLGASSYLAATVMIGALLEALLVARVDQVVPPTPVYKTKAVPKDKSGKPLAPKDWKLNSYIDVAHELGWIRQSARDISHVLRDYRNYVHPQKEHAAGIRIEKADGEMFWTVFHQLADQIINSVP